MNNFQRVDAISNSHVGRDFEDVALNYFKQEGINLIKGIGIPLGVGKVKKIIILI
ncbi:hypothetical protein [Metabacillus niabensis]|uniref:hypothetical protein n=1 Tax=Metabacillus niabensis TaxID=324854 RepID=UPI0039A2A84C